MLMPKRVKFRKQHRGRRAGQTKRGGTVDFGDYGLVACEAAWITARQIEAARIAMTRYIRRGGKVWIRIFPDKPYTKKPLETRMGKGKGPVEGWVCVVKPGRVMFEMNGVPVEMAKEAMRLAMHKLPIKCKFVVRTADLKGTQPAAVILGDDEEHDVVAPVEEAAAVEETTTIEAAAPEENEVVEVSEEAASEENN